MRYGAVFYLNARPLIEGLAPLTLDTPAGLVQRFERGEVDVALLPVAAAEPVGLTRVGSLGVAADGPVGSVLLFLSCDLAKVRTLAPDPASRTSRILAEVLLRRAHGLDLEEVEGTADAELVIGDPALERAGGGEPRLDLAEEWKRWTGLPFVFAAWYGDPAAEQALEAAYARGRERIASYAASPAEERYLREQVRHRLASRELKGLDRFLQEGRGLGLL